MTSPSEVTTMPIKDVACPECHERAVHNDLCPTAFRDERPVVCADCRKPLSGPIDSGMHSCTRPADAMLGRVLSAVRRA
jgi:hypothetical protein